jgi:hypothetical protein
MQPQNETSEELAQIAEFLAADKDGVTTVGGHRVLIVVDYGNHSPALASLLQLAEIGSIVVLPDIHVGGPREELLHLDEQMLRLDEQVLRLKAPEPLVVAEYFDGDPYGKSKGKGKRRRDWESPYGKPGGQHQQPQRNIKQMLRRRNGR